MLSYYTINWLCIIISNLIALHFPNKDLKLETQSYDGNLCQENSPSCTWCVWNNSIFSGAINYKNFLGDTSIFLNFKSAPYEDTTVVDIPFIYIITPTHDRLVQRADLTRLLNTLLNVPNLHWIVIEDRYNKSEKVENLLNSSRVRYTHLAVRTPPRLIFENENQAPDHKGVVQRNAGLQWLTDNQSKVKKPSVFYFADDDNTYSLQLFEEVNSLILLTSILSLIFIKWKSSNF